MLAQFLSQYSMPLRGRIDECLQSQGRLPVSVVQECLDISGRNMESLMLDLVPVAATWARTPISGFNVGAVALGMPASGESSQPGALYLGANMEFTGVPLNHSIHAEQSAVNHAWLHGETGLQAVATTAAPCGHCRQFLQELSTAKSVTLLRPAEQSAEGDVFDVRSLDELLPNAFGAHDLKLPAALMTEVRRNLRAETQSEAERAALDAANRSYAPYTECYAGAAVVTVEGRMYAGRYAENAAFNPSLTAVSSALAHLNMGQPPQQSMEIREVVIAEVSGPVSQYAAAEHLLNSLDPGIAVRRLIASGISDDD